jgi:hypothetical protein
MKKRWRVWLGLVLTIAIGTLLLPAVHWRLIGWSRGEAFFQGRPTSWWHDEIKHYSVVLIPTGDLYWVRERSSWITWLQTHISSDSMSAASSTDLALLRGQPEAVPVLIKLLQDEDDDVRYLAICALGRIGPAAKPVYDALLDAISKPNNAHYERAIDQALRRIDNESYEQDIRWVDGKRVRPTANETGGKP